MKERATESTACATAVPRWVVPWWAVVALATIVGGVLRLATLQSQSLWLDEYLSSQTATLPAATILTLADGESPLHALLLHALTLVGADSDWWLRLPSALAGTLAIPLLYLIGRQVENRATAAVATALFAIHPFAIWYAQEARMYSLVVLCALGATLAFLSLLREGDSRNTAAFAAWTTLGVGFHYYYVFPLAAHHPARRPIDRESGHRGLDPYDARHQSPHRRQER